MAKTTPERDWKYMKGLKEQLLAQLCERINREANAIITAREGSEHAKYLALYKHMQESDRIVGCCFDDWRRSTLFMRIYEIYRQGLLTETQMQGLSPQTQESLKTLEQFL